jgi:hypothetical protein
VFAATEDLKDCLLCPLSYFATGQCTAFTMRKPYPIIQTFSVESWEAAQEMAARLRDDFAAAIRDDEIA